MYHVLCGSLSRGKLLFRLLGALRIPETNLEPKLLSMPGTMLPLAIHMGRGSLFVSLFAGLFVSLFVCLDEAWVLKHGRCFQNFIFRNEIPQII